MQLQDEQLEALKNVDFSAGAEISDDVRFKVVDVLSDPANAGILSELSEAEIKLLTRMDAIATTFNDRIKKRIVRTYLTMKINKERKGRSRIEEIAINKVPEMLFGGQDKGFLSKFKRKNAQ